MRTCRLTRSIALQSTADALYLLNDWTYWVEERSQCNSSLSATSFLTDSRYSYLLGMRVSEYNCHRCNLMPICLSNVFCKTNLLLLRTSKKMYVFSQICNCSRLSGKDTLTWQKKCKFTESVERLRVVHDFTRLVSIFPDLDLLGPYIS
jgi:hypothetical protein